jgi:hypothetical protein
VLKCCGAGPFLCGSGSGSCLSKIPAPARTIFLIKFNDFHVFKKLSCFLKT